MPYGAITSRQRHRLRNGSARISPLRIHAWSPSRARRIRARSLASIASERSTPTNRSTTLATGTDRRPVPQPSSSTGPPARCAKSVQNRTSRRPTVRAFSQS